MSGGRRGRRGGYPLLNSAEAAEDLGVTPATVARWARSGRLRAIRMGAHWRFRPGTVRKLAAARRERTRG